ncbi:hypothetical protein PCANB_002467 [Pneumocystis canis]|nr:hypothetical protein PCK1_002529 [Pneumocystis canis]KAG5438747.1 hypothetical protein PCANB_002467 [Pneumocystis canis]
MIILLVRHGETDFNRNGKIQGSLDIPLNSIGNKQAIDLSNHLCNLKIDKILCSNLNRAKQTIEPFLKKKKDIQCQYFYELQENSVGSLSGLTWEEIKLKLKQEKKSLDDYGESKAEFIQRIMKFWKEKILPMKDHVSTLVIVTHGGYISTLVMQLLKQGLLYNPENIVTTEPPKNCSISIIQVFNNSHYDLLSYSYNTYLSSQEVVIGIDHKKIEDTHTDINYS